MGSPNTSTDDDPTSTEHSTTPRRNRTGKSSDEDATTPANKAQSATPKSAPAAARHKEPPTLLADFLLGRPSPARLAAERQRRQSVEAVKAELRQEMRTGAVRRIQPPGGVRDRVKAWQRSNAVVVDGTPDDAATEPTELAFAGEECESVTEEDRVRIKMRQKRRPSKKHALSKSTNNVPSWEELIANEKPRPVSPPKKRVVSDHNWMKDRPRKSPPRKVSPLSKKSTSPTRLPKDFVLRSQNPSVSNKVKEWAALVEKPESPTPRSHRSSKSYDGTRSAAQMDDDGIRVKPVRTKAADDDGIRITAVNDTSSEERRKEHQAARDVRRKARSSSMRKEKSDLDRIVVQIDPSELSQTDLSTEVSTVHPDTPTRKGGASKHKLASSRKLRSEVTGVSSGTGEESWNSDDDSQRDGSHLPLSELGSNLTAKTLADIPGDIPWGHSAFTELDLPVNGPARSRPKRTKVDRNSSFKGVTGVFKKVAEEGKKLMQDMNEPPKPQTANKPPSIETWLNTTIDPFVDNSTAPADTVKATPKKETGEPAIRKSSQSMRKSSLSASKVDSRITDESTELTEITDTTTTSAQTPQPTSPETPKEAKETKDTKTPTSSGLKRSRATRSSPSPLKTMGKRPFLGMLKEAFQGESKGHLSHPKVYQTVEERSYYDDEYTELSTELSTELTATDLTGTTDEYSDVQGAALKDAMTPAALSLTTPRLRPPTNGHHELSTIMSEGSSAIGSDVSSSDASHSTLTQSTGLTKDSDQDRTLPPTTGLKRRLTKHADLVSVLSLPDDGKVPDGIKSRRSRPSLRKTRGIAGDVTVDDLLKEFADDEGLYMRELKTLVDGVVPVLLTQVVDKGDVSNLFSNTAGSQASGISKSVVGMGVALEKLKNAHKKAPLTDIRRLAHWANGVVPIYHSYLGAWRLGFQDLYVNLAPRGGGLDDEDSLIGALPRDANGDIVDAQGQRVDVAYLLKRPLLRLKQMSKFIQCVDSMMPSHETAELLRDFEDLQEKARRRHREETARLADEDAAGTDTTRCRDFRNLAAMDAVTIDPQRQVSAKDIFSLDLEHSNGQRMECQVELVHRDRPNHPEDEGDLLIRETGNGIGRRSYLLFPPINISDISARTGDGNFDMVVMIRGSYAGKKWHELLTLTADDEDQILDWLDILPVSPVPPREPEPSVVGDPEDEPSSNTRLPDAPIGVRGFRNSLNEVDTPSPTLTRSPIVTPTKKPLPARYHPRGPALPTTPTATSPVASPGSERTPTQDDYREREGQGRTRSLSEAMRPDPSSFEHRSQPAPYREDGAPPPPAHRELSSSPSPKSRPRSHPQSSAKEEARVKRRTSSPLKHEYTPSDQSASDLSATEESASDSSDDEIESVDIPDTELGVSLQKPVNPLASVLSGSDCSLTPSNSASQAGLHGPKVAEENSARFLASVSRWSEKGAWKDLSPQACSILVTPGLIEVYTFRTPGASNSSDAQADNKPLVALDLTPLVLCRQSTTVDLEIRSSVQPHSRLANTYGGGNFRFRCHTGPDCFNLYMAVHHARLQNQKFIQLENEARFKSFGERRPPTANDGDSSSRRRSWFGRKNSYRGSVRAPSQSFDGASQTPSSSASATSFLKRWTVAGNLTFNIARSSVDRQSRAGSGGNSLYTSGSSSASGTPPRSPSISINNSSGTPTHMGTENLRIRLHLLITGNKWEDMGNCSLTISRPPPGWRQALRANHGMEKRITVSTVPRKDTDKAVTKLDAVLGSGCFSMLGTRGIVCGIWEEVKGADGVVGMVPENGATGGNVQRWCFQFASAGEANWVLRLVHQEVERA